MGAMEMNILDEMQSITEEEYYRALYNAEKAKPVDVKQQYINWIHANYRIGNGKMLVERMEDMQTQLAFIKEFNLPEETELI